MFDFLKFWKKKVPSFLCATCGQEHTDPPFSYGVLAPDAWLTMGVTPQQGQSALGEDLCIINNDLYFMKGNLHLPVLESPERFNYTVWVLLSPQDFERAMYVFEKPDRETEPPYQGQLANSIPLYPETLELDVLVRTQPIGQRPHIELVETDHPLYREQRHGISMRRVEEIAGLLLHQVG